MMHATLSKVNGHPLSQGGHYGRPRAARAAYTSYDGNHGVALAAARITALQFDRGADMGAGAVAQAIRRAVMTAAPGDNT